jgi:hypothetical protein
MPGDNLLILAIGHSILLSHFGKINPTKVFGGKRLKTAVALVTKLFDRLVHKKLD